MGSLNPFKKPKVDTAAIERREKEAEAQRKKLEAEEEERKRLESEKDRASRRARQRGQGGSLVSGLRSGVEPGKRESIG